MADKDYIKYLYTNDIELHNRINNTIEEILNSNIKEQEKNDLIKSLEYINNEYEKLESLKNFEKLMQTKIQ